MKALQNFGKYKIIICGSSSKLLSKEIATQLRGRCISSIIFPFSFKENLSLKKVEVKKEISKARIGEILGILNEYLEFGATQRFFFQKIKKRKRNSKNLLQHGIFQGFDREI